MTTLQEYFDKLQELSRPRTSNLCYAYQLKDGKIGGFSDVVCWAQLLYQIGRKPDEDEDDEEQAVHELNLDDEGNARPDNYWCPSTADLDKVLFSLVPFRPAVWDDEGYHKAVRTLLSVYEIGLEPATYEHRAQHGVLLNVGAGKLTRDQIGAFLVSFRNLGEQGRYRFLNRLTDAGLSAPTALLMNQFWVEDAKGAVSFSNGVHTMLTLPQEIQANTVKGWIKENPWFTISENQPISEITGAVNWGFYRHYSNSSYNGLTTYYHGFSEIQRTRKSWDIKYNYYIPQEVVEKIKELYNV